MDHRRPFLCIAAGCWKPELAPPSCSWPAFFLVGTVVTGQALVSVMERTPREFAVLMAMGVRRTALCRVVLVLAALLGMVGILCGLLGSLLLFGLATWHDVPVAMNPTVAILGLSLCSGLWATRGLLRAEPETLLR